MAEKKDITIAERLANIQAKLNAPKCQMNKFGGYKYRSCEDILEAVKPLLNGATLTLTDEIVVFGGNSTLVKSATSKDGTITKVEGSDARFYVRATAALSHNRDIVSCVAYAREPEVKKGMDEMQITGATSSYARKYALNGLFAIDDCKDADRGNNGNGDKPIEKSLEIVDKAFEEYQIHNMTYLEAHSGAMVDKAKFKAAIIKKWNKLPDKVESIELILKGIKLSDVLADEFDQKIAEDDNANAPS